MQLGARFGVDRVPFFVVREGKDETVYTSVLAARPRTARRDDQRQEEVQAIDVDESGGSRRARLGLESWACGLTRAPNPEPEPWNAWNQERGTEIIFTFPTCRPHSFFVSSSHHQRPSRSC